MEEKKVRQTMLIVLDGWGHREDKKDNAISDAKTPNFDAFWTNYPHSLLEASGRAVGLPEGQMGNSEVGHTTIGAGKIITNDLVRISDAVTNKTFGHTPAFVKLFNHVKQNNSAVHVCGLVSPGGVHSHTDHLNSFIHSAKEAGITKLYIHVFTDGRDTAPQSALEYITKLEEEIQKIGLGQIVSLSGRYYAMDRDNNWDRLARAEAVLFLGQGQTFTGRASELLKKLYSENIVDEKIEPYTILDSQGFAHPIQKNDGIFFFNFRADRARMLSTKIIEKAGIDNLAFVTLTEYEKGMRCDVAFAPVAIETTLANEVSKSGLSQAHVAETEKFAHATYFLNGGKETPHEKETHILVPSRKDVATHDLAPKMMAKEIADKVLEEIEKGTEFIFVNFANADMVGHTANVPAIIESVEEADIQLGRIVNELDRRGGVSIITADHGNAEMNIDQTTGEKHTAHTLNPVPFIITDKTLELKKGTLADIAPTTLQILKIKKPECMTGESLIAE